MITHGVFSNGGVEKLSNCEVDAIVVTNTIPVENCLEKYPKLRVFDKILKF